MLLCGSHESNRLDLASRILRFRAVNRSVCGILARGALTLDWHSVEPTGRAEYQKTPVRYLGFR